MFRKLKQGLGKGTKVKYRLDVAVSHVDGLPPGVAACRLQWARGAKVAVTKLAPVESGSGAWKEELSQIATLVRLPSGFEPKEYEFKLQAPGGGQKPPATIGKAALDMARFAGGAGGQQLALQVPVGGGRATLHLLVRASEVKGMASDDDALSVMTGASGLSSVSPGQPQPGAEQDLSGFRMDSSRGLGRGPPAAVAPAVPLPAALANPTPSSPRGSELQGAVVSAALGGAGPVASGAVEESQREADALRQELEARDARLAALQQQLSQAHAELAVTHEQLAAARAAAVADEGRAVQLQRDDSGPAREAERLRAELAAATVAAAAAATLREQLAEAQERAAGLEQQLAAAAQRPGGGGGGGGEETAAKLALAEQKIQQLVVLVQQQGKGSAALGDREAELEVSLQHAREEVEEAQAMAQEAMEMAELAQSEVLELRAEREALTEELADLQQQTEQAVSTHKWKEEREARREAEWDSRLKETYKRMEESVLLAERMQRERDELEERCAVLASEKRAVESQLDPGAVDQQVALEVEAARRAAEAQARVELEALQQRLRAMEEYVEEADVKRLGMAGRVAELEGQLASVRLGEEDSYDQVKAAEDRADGLSLELQYAQGEAARLAREVELALDQRALLESDYKRDVAEASSRADAAAQQLEEARHQLRQESALASELRSRVLLLGEELAAAQSQLAHAQRSGGGGAAAAAGLQGELAERQRAAEERAAQLDAMASELAGARANLADAQAQRQAAEEQLGEARRAAAANASKAAGLAAVLAAREAQLAQAQEAQRAGLALAAARGRSNGEGGGDAVGEEAVRQLEAERGAHAAELSRLSSELCEAQQLAQYSAGEMAGLVQALAEAQAERGEVAARLAEAREEAARLRSGPDGELRGRIERLEKEVTVQRNRADVNALFREEHDRIAQELVETKLVWAEAQEQLVKLKRSLVKSQEKNVTFSARLTKMETKMYSSFNGTAAAVAAADSVGKGTKKLGQKLGLRRKDKESKAATTGGDNSTAAIPE